MSKTNPMTNVVIMTIPHLIPLHSRKILRERIVQINMKVGRENIGRVVQVGYWTLENLISKIILHQGKCIQTVIYMG
jgi:hypothetical protein